jgi:hypothetical protein
MLRARAEMSLRWIWPRLSAVVAVVADEAMEVAAVEPDEELEEEDFAAASMIGKSKGSCRES